MEKRHIIIHILIALFTAGLLYLTIKPLINASDTVLFSDVIISGFTFSGLLILLKYIIRYGHFSSLIFRQKVINYIALGILFILCWLGLEYIILYLFFPADEWEILLPTLALRIVSGGLAYCLSVLIYHQSFVTENQQTEYDSKKEEDTQAQSREEDTENNIIKEPLERVAVKSGQKIEVIPVTEIIHLQAEGDYVMIHSVKGKFLKEQTMKSFENELPSDKFVRVHRSSIINVDFISQIELYDKQSQLLKMKNGAQIKISLSGYKALKNTLGL